MYRTNIASRIPIRSLVGLDRCEMQNEEDNEATALHGIEDVTALRQ